MQNKNIVPFDETNSSNPYLIDYNKKDLIFIKGKQLSSEYIWSLKGEERNSLVDEVFHYYNNKSFPNINFCSNSELIKEFKKLCDYNTLSIIKGTEISNSVLTGLKIVKHFCNTNYYSAKRKGGNSISEMFNNKEQFYKLLRNRMGYYTSKEDGTERPYIFGINDKMIIQGFRSSGIASIVSHFKPVVAKFIYEKYLKQGEKVLDYSMGWGARQLAAKSLNLIYYGIDPFTSEINEKINCFFRPEYKNRIINGVSEDIKFYENFEEVDLIFSSPPYFNMEIYSDDNSQCYNKYTNYNDWLNLYWKETVKNCLTKLKKGKYFSLVMITEYNKKELAKDMLNICIELGLELIESIPMLTSKSHLTNKKGIGNNKVNDIIYILKK